MHSDWYTEVSPNDLSRKNSLILISRTCFLLAEMERSTLNVQIRLQLNGMTERNLSTKMQRIEEDTTPLINDNIRREDLLGIAHYRHYSHINDHLVLVHLIIKTNNLFSTRTFFSRFF